MNVDRARRGHNQVLKELNEERAAALQRISGTLSALIDQLRALRERVRESSGAEREFELATWQRLRAMSVKYRWYLEVQREAIGLRSHSTLDEFYAIPTLEDSGETADRRP